MVGIVPDKVAEFITGLRMVEFVIAKGIQVFGLKAHHRFAGRQLADELLKNLLRCTKLVFFDQVNSFPERGIRFIINDRLL